MSLHIDDHQLFQPLRETLYRGFVLHQVLGYCICCTRPIRVWRSIESSCNLDRYFASCLLGGHGNFVWLTPVCHPTLFWPRCKCVVAEYCTFEKFTGGGLFKCWLADSLGGCDYHLYVASGKYSAHKECVTCCLYQTQPWLPSDFLDPKEDTTFPSLLS